MELIDLHVHSNRSDGTLSPASVVSLALSKELKAIALTDHDTVDGIAEALHAAEGTSLEVVPGTELSCLYHGKEIHILGLYIDYESPALNASLTTQREARNQRNEEMIRRFRADGILFTMDELKNSCPDTVITRAHFARVLIEKGYVTSTDQAFKKYLDHDKKYCPPKAAFSPEEAIHLICAAGGFPAIAHPIQYKLGWKETERMILEFKEMGLKGIEVYYTSHCSYESMRLQEICNTYHLLPTGGSDFHGANKPDIQLGCGRGKLRVSALLLNDIKKEQSASRSPLPYCP
ncbi:MAG: PHP domain-containing protein [Clostridium sp.]